VFNGAGLRRFWFPASKMPKYGGDWPTVKEMIRRNHRLIVFTSNATKEAREGIAYVWNYVVENQCESHTIPSRSSYILMAKICLITFMFTNNL